MPGWNGAGIYDLRYNFVNDASGGIKILAARQDQMWGDAKLGFQNCMTLDGQTTPTASINLGNQKIINLLAGVAASDAARIDQIVSSQWSLDTHTSTWINATSFKLLGADLTTSYTPGRRVKFLDNGNQRYGTVVSSSFAVDTTIVLAVDGGTVLVGPTTVVYAALLSSANPSVPIFSEAFFLGTSVVAVNGVSTLWNISGVGIDLLSEITTGAAGKFTAKVAGLYKVSGIVLLQSAAGTTGIAGQQHAVTLFKNGAGVQGMSSVSWPYADSLARSLSIPIMGYVSLVAGDFIDVRVQMFFTGAAPSFFVSDCNISRVF